VPTILAPRFVYGTGPTTLDLSQRLDDWAPLSSTEGERNVAASGIPTSYLIRTDHGASVTIVFSDAEWPSLWAFLEWAMGPNRSFLFYFDQTDGTTGYTVYLDRPEAGDRVLPRRMPTGEHWALDLEIRRVTGGAFVVPMVG